jgi:transposase
MVRSPTPEEEDRRRIGRERRTLMMERVQHVNRIKGLLFAQGIYDYEPMRDVCGERLQTLVTGDGRPLCRYLLMQLRRELARLALVLEQIRAVEVERDLMITAAKRSDRSEPVEMLLELRGIGPEAAEVLWSEGLFRRFENRRQLAAYAGLAPTPWQSGSVDHEQGVSKAGNPRLRTVMIQIAWLWLRHQPKSALTRWFETRVERSGGRQRKTAIVALARKLLVAIWRYVTAGVVIEGAVHKHA